MKFHDVFTTFSLCLPPVVVVDLHNLARRFEGLKLAVSNKYNNLTLFPILNLLQNINVASNIHLVANVKSFAQNLRREGYRSFSNYDFIQRLCILEVEKNTY